MTRNKTKCRIRDRSRKTNLQKISWLCLDLGINKDKFSGGVLISDENEIHF